MLRFLSLSLALLAAIIAISPARADWLNATGAEKAPNFAEITVCHGHVRVALEIDFADYPKFVELAPQQSLDANGRPRLELFRQRIANVFHVSAGGTPLGIAQVRSAEIVKRPVKAAALSAASMNPGVNGFERSSEVVLAVLDFPFSGQPADLTFAPPQDENGVPSVTLGFIARHGRVPITDYRFLSTPEELSLNWSDPWFSAFTNPNLARHHKSPLMSFVSVEPREVRLEVIFRLVEIAKLSDRNMPQSGKVDAVQLEPLLDAASATLRENIVFTIDGRALKPDATTRSRLNIGVDGITVRDDAEPIDPKSDLFGIIFSFARTDLPKEIGLRWEKFPDGRDIPVQFIDPAGAVPSTASTGDNLVQWKNLLKHWRNPEIRPLPRPGRIAPRAGLIFLCFLLSLLSIRVSHRSGKWRRQLALLSLALIVSGVILAIRTLILLQGPPGKSEVQDILEALTANMSVAMLEASDRRFEKELAKFVTPKSLGAVGAEMQRGLALRLPTGARALTGKIDHLRIENVTSTESGFNAIASWTTEASGGHWGHMHRRIVEYRAQIGMRLLEDRWQLDGLTVIQARVDP